MIRAISYSEVSTFLRCEAQWDYQYGDRLAGSALKPKDTPAILREGRAWGRAVAALHGGGLVDAVREMDAALREDATSQQKHGVYNAESHAEMRRRLTAILAHYDATGGKRLKLTHPEHELLVRLPSRTGAGFSNRYRLHSFLDGLHTDEHGRIWIVEFKLRGRLSSLEQIANSRQIRYYAWAWLQETGERVTGVIVDERLNEAPKPARILKSGKPSHAKDQLCTAEAYEQACLDAGEGPHTDVMEALEARRWQQRVPVFLTDDEIEEAGHELVSLGRQIQQLDSHQIYPVRDVRQQNCAGCRFKEICANPSDRDLVDALFDRAPAKRDLPALQTNTQPKELAA